jgi:5-methylcytosine-specific restriction endonuclease McrA
VSAGGNSSQRTTVTLNTQTIDAEDPIQQFCRRRRALMTARLRTFMKTRDRHTCRYCSVSLAVEPHLLPDVAHVVPVSKGGMTTEENLQTLCWRCNRTKSTNILSV